MTWRKASRSSDNGGQCVEVAVVETQDAVNES
jgi:hypothetical protein